MSHYGIPWPLLRRAYRLLRRRFFTVPVPDTTIVHAGPPVETLRVIFGKAHFTNGWELSYAYHGEDLNMRRPEYDETDARPWKQTHVRGFTQPDGSTVLIAHYEYEPTAYPDAHLHEENFEIARGVDAVRNVLDAADVTYTVSEP